MVPPMQQGTLGALRWMHCHQVKPH